MPTPLPKQGTTSSILWPSGRIIPDRGAPRLWRFYPSYVEDPAPVYENDRQLWLWLNWIIRPPLTDLEILAMSAMDVVRLYYSMRQPGPCGTSGWPDDIISKGLPYPYAINYERGVQYRIYNLRPDLHFVYDSTGKRWPLIATPSTLDTPGCNENAMAIQALSSFASILTFGAAAAISIILTVATETAGLVNDLENAKMIGQLSGRFHDIAVGIQLAKAGGVANRQLTPLGVSTLSAYRQRWQQLIAELQPYAEQSLVGWRRMPYPENTIAAMFTPSYRDVAKLFTIECLDGVSPEQNEGNARCWLARYMAHADSYAKNWEPYDRFFYSDSVEQQVNAADGSLLVPQTQILSTP